MKTINEFTQEDNNTLQSILSMRTMTNAEVINMQNFMNIWIDNKIFICGHCSSQIRFAHSRLQDWYEINKATIESILNPTAIINSCLTCGAELNDKRKKYCSQECKDAKLLID